VGRVTAPSLDWRDRFPNLRDVRWGIGIALLSVVVGGLGVAPSEAGAQAPWPNYHPVDYEPAEPRPPAAAPAAPLPRNRFSVRRMKRVRANGRAIVFVRVFAPGRVFVWGRGIRTVGRGTQQPRVVRVPVKPKLRLRSWLRRKGKGRIRVKLAFRPFGGIAREPRERTILLRKKRRRR
jgi:hypothetical protein